MKKGLTTLKRVLSLVMVFAMFITLLPPTVSAAGTTKTIYFKSGEWSNDNAWFEAWVWGTSLNGAWYDVKDNDADGIHEIEVPTAATQMKLIRRGPGQTANSWDGDQKWNETGDLKIDSNNCFTLTYWSGGTWSVYDGPTFTVAGDAGLCGSNWAPAATANDMTKNASGVWEKVYTNVAADTYEYKVAVNHSWDLSWGASGKNGSNASVTVDDDGSTVTVTFNPSTKAISAKVVKEYSVTFNGTNVNSDGAATVEKGKDYTATLAPAEGYELPESVDVTVGGEAVEASYDANTGVLTITGVTGDVVITAEGVKPAPTTRTIYLKAGVWDVDNA